jgi:Tfp pilus assembly protein FimT
VERVKLHRYWTSERGFALMELLIIIAIMGILVAAGISLWVPVVEARRVDSATNQVASDLQLAHTKATNGLTNWRVEFAPNSRNYRTGSCVSPCTATLSTPLRSVEEGTEFPPGPGVVAVVFKPDGTAQILPNTGIIRVAADDGSPCHQIGVNTVTSRVEVSTNVC